MPYVPTKRVNTRLKSHSYIKEGKTFYFMDYTTTSLFEKMNPLRVALLDGNLRTRRSIVLCSVLLLISAFYVRQTSCSASHLSEICQDADHPPSSASESWIGSFFPTAQASNISDQCVQDTRNYIAALCNHTMWAIKSKFSREIHPPRSAI